MAGLTDNFDYDVTVIGAGFGGITALHKLRSSGLRVRVFEAAPSVGGTWYWNRYPGARVDIESLEYSLPFPDLQQEWSWSEKYAAQPELLAYMTWVVDRLDLREDIELHTRLVSAEFMTDANGWRITLARGGRVQEITTRYLVLATGFLSVPNVPNIPGLEDFAGTYLHSTAWPEQGVELSGKRVGVLGTAASGIQIIQTIAPEVSHLTVFQRTANWCSPLRNEPMHPEYQTWARENYDLIRDLEYGSLGSDRSLGTGIVLVGGVLNPPLDRRGADVSAEERRAEWEKRWHAGALHIGRSYNDVLRDREVNAHLQEFLTEKIQSLVHDPETARKLTPTHPPFTRRPPGSTNYYETYNRENVELVDVKADPIARVTPTGVVLESGARHELDVLILATGFDAGSGAALAIDVRGRGGLPLREHWGDGARTDLGLMTSSFPNMFFINGPQSPGVHFSPPLLGVYQVNLINRILTGLASHPNPAIDVTREAEERWTQIVADIYANTLIPETDSWWMGTNIPGKPRRPVAFAGGFPAYKQHAEEAIGEGMRGFRIETDVLNTVGAEPSSR